MKDSDQLLEQLKERYPLQIGENTPILRTICDEVKQITPAIHDLGEALLALMRAHQGVGLAAPQVDQKFRMAAVTQRDISREKRELEDELIIINPIVI